jgi:inositol phosphorylceramide mannosyltransferase catalytic subunit
MIPFPKIIHQTWKNTEIPEKWKISQQEWLRLHPTDKGWQYILWTDDMNREYIKNKYPDFLSVYDSFKYPIQRADAIRYFILKDFGGVYSDLDVIPRRSLEEFDFSSSGGDDEKNKNSLVWLMHSVNTPCNYTNSFMISQVGAKLWTYMINYMTTWKQTRSFITTLTKHTYVMFSTGPSALSKVIEKYDGLVCVLPSIYFRSTSVKVLDSGDEKNEAVQNNAYIYAVDGSSWHSLDTKILNFFVKNWEWLCVMLSLFIIAGFVFFYTRCRGALNSCKIESERNA